MKGSAEEREEELRSIKEAEREALAVALYVSKFLCMLLLLLTL
jgi:hypothetical protein